MKKIIIEGKPVEERIGKIDFSEVKPGNIEVSLKPINPESIKKSCWVLVRTICLVNEKTGKLELMSTNEKDKIYAVVK